MNYQGSSVSVYLAGGILEGRGKLIEAFSNLNGAEPATKRGTANYLTRNNALPFSFVKLEGRNNTPISKLRIIN